MRRKLIASVLAALLLMTMGAASAGAAPVNNPNAEVFTLVCDNGETYEIVTASGNPAHILGTTQRVIPHHFTFELIAVDESGETVLFAESEGVGEGEKEGLQDRLVTCTVDVEVPPEEREFIEEEFGIDLTGLDVFFRITVEVMFTPAGQS